MTLAAVAVGGNVLLYTSLDDKTEVIQMSRTVRAGQVVTADDVRVVEVDVDPTVRVIEASDIGRVVNSYARVFLPEGSLVVDGLVQPTPLVSNDAGVVAVEIRPSRVPTGLTERSQVLLVIAEDGSDEPTTVAARVVTSGKGADTGGVQA
ncbi:MAG: hypothetical protein HKN41_10690, partial [Ilumatobacter sp.]|nr:hypothetical protein [Ilumatobacter sp.]